MKTRNNNLSSYWPLVGLIACILVTVGDIGARVLSVTYPPGLVGAAILLSGYGIMVVLRLSTDRVSWLGGLASVVAIGTTLIAATISVPTSNSIHLLAIAVSLGIGGAAFLLSLRAGEKRRDYLTASRFPERNLQESSDMDFELEATVVTDLQSDLDHLFEELGTEEPVHQSDGEPEGEIVQYIRRVRLEDGGERLEGSVTLQFAAGEKIQHYHLPISPAFQAVPTAWGESSDSEVRIDFNIVQTYGIRLTARRGSGSLAEASVEVDFLLESRFHSQAAA